MQASKTIARISIFKVIFLSQNHLIIFSTAPFLKDMSKFYFSLDTWPETLILNWLYKLYVRTFLLPKLVAL